VVALTGSFLLPLLFAIWVGRRAQNRFVLPQRLEAAVADAVLDSAVNEESL
jgi:hypothetical protein